MNTRPKLRSVELAEMTKPGIAIITMSVGQWDMLLQTSYESGWLLLELDDDEQPISAYRKD